MPRLRGESISRTALARRTGRLEQVAGVRLVTLADGAARGVRVHAVVCEPGGTVPVAVINPGRGIGVYEVHARGQLPFHTMWRMLGEGCYAVAMEPTTNRDAGRFDARERGELVLLDPGETRRYDLEVGVLDGAGEIDEFESRIPGALRGPAEPVGSRVDG